MSVGERLKQVRLARGFSLDELVVEIGGIVTKQALSKYETGKSKPTVRVLNALASTLGVKASYFFNVPSFAIDFHGFRKKSGMRVREREKVQHQIKHLLENRIDLQRLAQEERTIDFPIHEYRSRTPRDIEEASLDLRHRWEMGLAPVSSVVETLEEKHVHVLELDENNNFDGQSATVIEDNDRIIAVAVVSRKMDCGERQRLTLLHELGHIVLKPSGNAKEDEKNAFRFAASFLVPQTVLTRMIGERRRFLDVHELILLKKRFGISIQALLYRMKDLKIISESQYRKWCIFINKQGWKKKEPEMLPREEPQWLRRTVYQGLAEGWLNRNDAERMLGETIELSESLSLRSRRAFMKLSIEQRRKILEKQSQDLAKHYSNNDEWKDLEGGEIVEY